MHPTCIAPRSGGPTCLCEIPSQARPRVTMYMVILSRQGGHMTHDILATLCDESRAIISNKLRNSTPMTENVLKNKRRNRRCVLRSQHMPFQIRSQSALSLDDVAVAARSRHNHSIDMDFVKESTHDRNSQGDVQSGGLANVAFMASADVPRCYGTKPGPSFFYHPLCPSYD